jgi:hypothetical protein
VVVLQGSVCSACIMGREEALMDDTLVIELILLFAFYAFLMMVLAAIRPFH